MQKLAPMGVALSNAIRDVLSDLTVDYDPQNLDIATCVDIIIQNGVISDNSSNYGSAVAGESFKCVKCVGPSVRLVVAYDVHVTSLLGCLG